MENLQNNETFDIVALLQNHPLMKLCNVDYGPLIKKIKEYFTPEQLRIYIANLICYSSFDTRRDFAVEFENVWKLLEFSRADNAKSLLINNFILGIDYIINKGKIEIEEEKTENKSRTRSFCAQIDRYIEPT